MDNKKILVDKENKENKENKEKREKLLDDYRRMLIVGLWN